MTPQTPIPNDDDDIDPEEIAAAADETPTEITAPEVTAGTEELVEWDDAPASSGSSAPKVGADDETTIAEQLIAEGTDEAERERRLAAADPDFEP